MVAIAATPPGDPLPVHADPEVERWAALTPPELADELVARGVACDPDEAARIVEESAQAALAGKPVPGGEKALAGVSRE